MALPTLKAPEYTTTLPSTQETVAFRPFLVKEEKILLMAQQGKDKDEIIRTVYKLLENCIKTPINPDTLPMFDIEWLFLQLRSKSVGEEVELRLKHLDDPNCDGVTDVVVNLNEVKVSKPETHSNIVQIDDNLSMTMKYPNLTSLNIGDLENPDINQMFGLLKNCIVNVFDKETVYNDFSPQELEEFLGNLGQTQFKRIMDFFSTSPKIKHDVTFTCAKCGKPVKYTLEGLMDFFL